MNAELSDKEKIRAQLLESMGAEAAAKYEIYSFVISDLETGVRVCRKMGVTGEADRLQKLADDLRMVGAGHAAHGLSQNSNSEKEVQAVDPLAGLIVGTANDMMKGIQDD